MFSIGGVVSNTSHCWRIFFHPQTYCLDIGAVMTYILVVWLDNSITSAFYLCQRVFIIYLTVLFVIAFSAFRSIRSRIFYPQYTLVPRFPFSHFQSPHAVRARSHSRYSKCHQDHMRLLSVCHCKYNSRLAKESVDLKASLSYYWVSMFSHIYIISYWRSDERV